MELSFLSDYFIPVITGICLCVGSILKRWIADTGHKYIPTVCAILGAVLAVWMSREFSPAVLLQGMFSGLAATGLHQVFHQALGQTFQKSNSTRGKANKA
ncbi:phage holin family protein [uncultured Ruthenibacterium sp.]|uniref:phage holin family protein n=1 Tax=uncultured Ruthenibacterium sp. TaxID=1905347 RepID=UPI00349EAD7A